MFVSSLHCNGGDNAVFSSMHEQTDVMKTNCTIFFSQKYMILQLKLLLTGVFKTGSMTNTVGKWKILFLGTKTPQKHEILHKIEARYQFSVATHLLTPLIELFV